MLLLAPAGVCGLAVLGLDPRPVLADIGSKREGTVVALSSHQSKLADDASVGEREAREGPAPLRPLLAGFGTKTPASPPP